MELLERDTDGPIMIQIKEEQHPIQEQEQHQQEEMEQMQHQQSTEDEEMNQSAMVEQQAEAETEVETEAEAEAEQQTEAESPVEEQPPAEVQSVPAPAATFTEADIESALVEVVARARSQQGATVGARSRSRLGWRNGPPRHRRGRRRSIRAERERIARQARDDAVYAQNLRKLAERRQKWSVPSPQVFAEKMAKVQKKSEANLVTPEEAQVESLLQIHQQPMVKLNHVQNVKSKLTPELLHGTGLHNADNRRATEAGLLASKDNHPPAPSLAALPPAPAAGIPQPNPISFIAKSEESRPAYVGPKTADLPSLNIPHPTVLKAQPKAQQQPAPVAPERAFVEGLPAEFMELDSATQLHILSLVDAGVDVDKLAAKKMTPTKPTEAMSAPVATKPTLAAKAAPKSEAKPTALVESKSTTTTASKSNTKSKASVDEAELSAAASTLNALAELQRESHVPFGKLVHLLAQTKLHQ